jgi:hypothetical protein
VKGKKRGKNQPASGIEPAAALPYFEQAFRATKHPAYVWEALLVILTARLPFPAWVLTYLQTAASHWNRLAHTTPPPRDPAAAICQAFGFTVRQGRNPFRALETDLHDHLIAFALWNRLDTGEKFTSAVLNTAMDHPAECVNQPPCTRISPATVARYWKAHRTRLPPLPPNKTR